MDLSHISPHINSININRTQWRRCYTPYEVILTFTNKLHTASKIIGSGRTISPDNSIPNRPDLIGIARAVQTSRKWIYAAHLNQKQLGVTWKKDASLDETPLNSQHSQQLNIRQEKYLYPLEISSTVCALGCCAGSDEAAALSVNLADVLVVGCFDTVAGTDLRSPPVELATDEFVVLDADASFTALEAVVRESALPSCYTSTSRVPVRCFSVSNSTRNWRSAAFVICTTFNENFWYQSF